MLLLIYTRCISHNAGTLSRYKLCGSWRVDKGNIFKAISGTIRALIRNSKKTELLKPLKNFVQIHIVSTSRRFRPALTSNFTKQNCAKKRQNFNTLVGKRFKHDLLSVINIYMLLRQTRYNVSQGLSFSSSLRPAFLLKSSSTFYIIRRRFEWFSGFNST